MTSKVLITGGTGFVGKWMRKTQPPVLLCDYFGKELYENREWKKLNYNCYVHLANISPKEVILAAKKNSARLLYCSSGITYYPIETEYSNNKIEWELECVMSGVDFVIARLFTFFGKGLDDGKAYTQFVKAAREGRPLEVWGDCTRSYMHGVEMARRMWDLLLTGESGEIRDIGSTRPHTVLRLAQRISAFTGAPIKFVEKNVQMPYYVPKGK